MAAQRVGVALEALELRGPEEFEAAFATAKQRNAQALLVFDDILTITYRSRITALAASSRLPAMYPFSRVPGCGGPDVLRGERPRPLAPDCQLRGQDPEGC